LLSGDQSLETIVLYATMDKKRFSYNQIHASIAAMAQDPKLQEFKPTMILAIGEVPRAV
jgi:hypothetical protein